MPISLFLNTRKDKKARNDALIREFKEGRIHFKTLNNSIFPNAKGKLVSSKNEAINVNLIDGNNEKEAQKNAVESTIANDYNILSGEQASHSNFTGSQKDEQNKNFSAESFQPVNIIKNECKNSNENSLSGIDDEKGIINQFSQQNTNEKINNCNININSRNEAIEGNHTDLNLKNEILNYDETGDIQNKHKTVNQFDPNYLKCIKIKNSHKETEKQEINDNQIFSKTKVELKDPDLSNIITPIPPVSIKQQSQKGLSTINTNLRNDLESIKTIFQKQLPKMPKEYIFRQVFDPKHRTLVMLYEQTIIGGICYRPFYERNFIEIVFCAIDSDAQIKGHGGFMMDFFKEHVKNEYCLNSKKGERGRVRVKEQNGGVERKDEAKSDVSANKNENNIEEPDLKDKNQAMKQTINLEEHKEETEDISDEKNKDKTDSGNNNNTYLDIDDNNIAKLDDNNQCSSLIQHNKDSEQIINEKSNEKFNNTTGNDIILSHNDKNGHKNSTMSNQNKNNKESEHFNINKNIENVKTIVGLNINTYHNDSLSYLHPKYTKKHLPLYLMTYADNYAIGYFRKNGFSTDIRFKNWLGCIKDYDGGTLMQSKIIWNINYIEKDKFIIELQNNLIKLVSQKCAFNVERTCNDPKSYQSIYDIPGLKECGLTDEMLIKRPKEEHIKDLLKYLLADLQGHASAWPFLLPVKHSEVPDYHSVIKNPMDLSTMEKKIDMNFYTTVQQFIEDFNLIVKNCCIYNAPQTQYYKCGQNLKEYFHSKIALFKIDE